MPRLIRPSIPVAVKCRVVLRQLGEMWPDQVLQAHPSKGKLLAARLPLLAELLGCEVGDLRCDHDPALGARQKVFKRGVHIDYIPKANDPEHLFYRPHGPRFDRSHLIKTNVRGDHGQHPDRVLIKKNRKLERRLAEKPRRPRRGARPLRSANRWPPKGSQKIRGRR